MNVLSMGLPFGVDNSILAHYTSRCGHEVRTLSTDAETDYTFEAGETASAVMDRIGATWQADLLLCWVPELFPPPRAVEHCPIKTAAIISDWNIYYPQLEYNLSRYDVVVTDKLGAQTLRPPGSSPQYLFPLYSQRTSVHRPLAIDKNTDVVFAGNLNHVAHPARGRCLEIVASFSDRYRIVIGCGYEDETYAELLNRARIVFNHSIRREMNLRCFETLACGSLLFLEEDNLEAADWLRDREEVVLYRPDNLASLIEHYLENSKETERIARQGHAKAAALSGENRLDELLNRLEQFPKGDRAFRELDPAEQALAEILHYASSLVPGQYVLAQETCGEALRTYPQRPEFMVAAAASALLQLDALAAIDRQSRVKDLLALLRKAAEHAPDAAPIWLNIAAVCRMGGAAEIEARCLERIFDAPSCVWGSLLLGRWDDPYYVTWRTALAQGAERVEILWAAAASRLAILCLDNGDQERASDLAQRSIDWLPDIATPYNVLAQAKHESGDSEAAAGLLSRALPLTAFDAGLRLDLVKIRQALGQDTAARKLAEESARLFRACPHAEATAQEFAAVAHALASGG
jgi:tetratricopeptide (TPR) repeat protein